MTANDTQKKIINTIVQDCLSVRLRLINRMVGRIYDNALKPHGIRSTQFSVLAAVSAADTTTSQQLSRVLHMDTSTFSRTLGILKKNGWLDTEPSGQGKTLTVRITPEGLAKIESAYPDWQKAQKATIEILGASTAEQITSTGTRHLLRGMAS